MWLFSALLCLTTGIGFLEAINIDGKWSPWSNIQTDCVKTDPDTNELVLVSCGGGKQTRYRSCTNPVPQGQGQNCSGEPFEEFDCNTHPCQLPGSFLWSAWSECSKKCGRGTKTRFTMCGSIREKADGLVGSGAKKRKKRNVNIAEEDLDKYELEYGAACQGNQKGENEEDCNDWDLDNCPRPCLSVTCPPYAECEDTSNATDPSFECICKLGTTMKDDGSACIEPPPTTPTPRPIPTLPADQKAVSTVITRGASTLIVVFLGITLIMFLVLRIFDPSRVIHMNMEIALMSAHICLLPAVHENNEELCRVVSILVHYFYTTAFMFMALEAIHLYSLVTWVVKSNGMLTRMQNTVVGWGLSFLILLGNLCFFYDEYGGVYHCWLQMDSALLFGQYIPIITLVILTFAIVEAAGSSDNYERLDDVDKQQRLTAQIMQRTLIFILPMVLASYILGTMAEYEQNLYLYSLFTLANGILGGIVFFFHCTANESVRAILSNMFRKCCKKKE